MMAAKSEVGLDKEPQSGSGSSGDHALGASPEPITLESMDFVGFFPEEVTDMILSLLSANDREKCSSVSQLWSSTIKRFQQGQISRLKYNWENGRYSVHCFPISDEFSYLYVFGVEEIASNYSYDQCPYFSAYATKNGVRRPIYFSVVHIDAELRKTTNHCQYTGFFGRVKEVCVWGGSIIWTCAHESLGALHYYNATLTPDTEMKTIDEWNFSNPYDIWNTISLKMDRNFIAVSNNQQYVKAWCKHTLELKLEQKCRDGALQQISLFDGCLVISNTFKTEPYSVIEIHNLKSNSNNGSTLEHTFTVDGKVQNLHSNKHFIVLDIILCSKTIQVFNKQSYSIIYSYDYDSISCCRFQSAHDDYIVVLNDDKYPRILNPATRKWSDIPSYALWTVDHLIKLWTVFDNIAVIRNLSDKTLQVFDWERNTQLLTLVIPEQISDKYVVASVTEMRIVIVDTFSNQVVVFKFG
ncbi:uncharacterized protein LOC111058178 isoform X1 [Nilaparvata lugens]|uniref:uncharacterized protein LOC111058178 isoform X1 n=1 Tax=Nilaparvata lugens TaxID=108931 RepID=UPI00193CF897|nr:uncharacterized protein LOC111058178 isoform X1 [Nilaparvata lugens]XP_039293540.1 uncharacterized protein LOC111058178 isoform X1 [Nilaparvata lugens]